MTIKQDFPYAKCVACPNCILVLHPQAVQHDNSFMTREVIVQCKRAAICRKWEEVAYAGNEHCCE